MLINKVNLPGTLPKGFEIGKATLQLTVIASLSTLTSDLQTLVNASINNYTEPENEQDAAEESDSSLPDLEPIMTEEPDFDNELPPYIPIWMRNSSLPVSESEENDWDADVDCEMEPQSRAETSHGRNIERVSLFNVETKPVEYLKILKI